MTTPKIIAAIDVGYENTQLAVGEREDATTTLGSRSVFEFPSIAVPEICREPPSELEEKKDIVSNEITAF